MPLSGFAPNDVFVLDPNIRWVGLATNKGQVIFEQMCPGVKSLTPGADDRLLLEVRAQYITEVCDQVDQWSGPTQYIAMVHERFIELIVMLREKYLVMTLETNVSADTFASLSKRAQGQWFDL